jgi:hypothetical protein
LPGVQTRQRRWEDELRLKALLVGRKRVVRGPYSMQRYERRMDIGCALHS